MGDLCVKDGQTVLFIGDSITDCGRRNEHAPFGDGYVGLFIDLVTARWPERTIRYINKGIGGHTAHELAARWHDDVIVNQPDWLTVMIGINDLHRHLRDAPEPVSPEEYAQQVDDFLARTTEATEAKLVLLDPFYISTDDSDQSWRGQALGLIPHYIETVHAMADEYGARLVETHAMFQRHLQHRSAEAFAPEPVHPNRTGHLLIAHELLRVMTD